MTANVNKRICFVMNYHPDYRIGGSEIQAWFLARSLAGRGLDVHYVSGYYEAGEQTTIRDGVHIHRFRLRKNIERIGFDILSLIPVYRLLKKIGADVYYQRCSHPYTGLLAYLAKSTDAKFVWASASVQDFSKRRFTSPLDRYKGNILKKPIVSLAAKFADRLYTYGVRNANKILVQAAYQQDLLANAFGLDSVIIRNGHPVPAKLREKEDPPTILWLASLKRMKRAELFIRLARECADLDCRFVLAGRPSDVRYAADLRKQIQEQPNLNYAGSPEFERSNDLIERSNIFVNTSEHEGFPNTFIQAWLRRVPVVSLDVDPDNVLSRERIGFKSGTFDALCRDVRKLIEDKSLRETMGDKARSYANNNHSIESTTRNFMKVLESLH